MEVNRIYGNVKVGVRITLYNIRRDFDLRCNNTYVKLIFESHAEACRIKPFTAKKIVQFEYAIFD